MSFAQKYNATGPAGSSASLRKTTAASSTPHCALTIRSRFRLTQTPLTLAMSSERPANQKKPCACS
jgi:hypothetical protein